MPTVVELQNTLTERRAQLKALFDANKNEKGEYTFKSTDLDEVNRRNDELNELAGELERVQSLARIEKANNQGIKDAGNGVRPPFADGERQDRPERKSLGQLFVESKEYKSYFPSPGENPPISNVRMGFEIDGITLGDALEASALKSLGMKATFERTAGWDPFVPRIPRVVLSAQRRPVVQDLIPTDTISVSSIKFIEETTFGNNAAAVAEGGTLAESQFQVTERTQAVEKIGHWLPVTEEQLADVPQARAYVDNRLVFGLQLAEETQILSGTGTSPQLMGFHNKAGVQTQAKGADPVPDAVYKAMTLIRHTGFAEPTAAAFHPNDWQDVRLLRTADGVYIWGSPADPGVERIWGLPVIVTTAEPENTALLGDFQMYSQLSRREGIRIEVSNSHGSFFIEGKLAIRAQSRLVLVIYRAAAFCKVTGI